jgi:predicted O-methyltransferase YrrM
MFNRFTRRVQSKIPDGTAMEAFLAAEAGIEGFFSLESAALWDCLLSTQEKQQILGDMLEIGVYKGRSALMSSLHLRVGERFVLVDATEFMKEAEVHLKPILGNRAEYIYKMSGELRFDRELTSSKFRWIHIDGDHTGRSVLGDLEICEPLLSDDGCLVIDDFFSPMYPQLTETVYDFLSANHTKLTLQLVGWNKAYLCRPLHARFYRRFIVHDLAAQLRQRNITAFSITKTTSLEESPTFGICARLKDQDYYGLDSNPKELPL